MFSRRSRVVAGACLVALPAPGSAFFTPLTMLYRSDAVEPMNYVFPARPPRVAKLCSAGPGTLRHRRPDRKPRGALPRALPRHAAARPRRGPAGFLASRVRTPLVRRGRGSVRPLFAGRRPRHEGGDRPPQPDLH
jgi:hypothetical protein